MSNWEHYYRKNQDRPLRDLYVRAEKFIAPNMSHAMDVGFGVGTEVLELLRRGLGVHALDSEPKAIELLLQKVVERSNLHVHFSALEEFSDWPTVDFLFAHHSFLFCREDLFEGVVEAAFFSVKKNGILAVSFFGPGDDWVLDGRATGISRAQLEEKLNGFEILDLAETKKSGPTALNGEKVWHVIELIARRL